MIENEIKNILSNKYSNDPKINKKLLEVLFLAQSLLRKYNLKQTEFQFGKSRKWRGLCVESGVQIKLEISFVKNNEIKIIEEVILHEIAHALVGNEFSHHIEWQLKALELGLSLDHIKRYKL